MSPGRLKPNLWRILSDTYRVISGHPGQFSILSLLFIFPTSIGPAIYAVHLQPNLRFLNIFSTAEYEHQIPSVGESSILLQLLYSLSTLFFTTCAGGSITYSVHHGFNGRPVDVISAVKSIMVSFLPILATNILVQIFTGLIISAFMALLLLVNIWMSLDRQNGYIVVLYIAVAVLLAAVLIYLQIVWSLTNAVVVVESNWGYSALKRSSYLVKGARGVMFFMSLLFGALAGVLAMVYLKLVAFGDEWNGWFVVNVIVVSGISTVVMLYSLAAVTVFFICCKASHQEPESQIDDKIVEE